ncbi:hypothetical protein BDZ89DRAFT_1044876 [Hymenopellis radicata]|nr:hypothetical protein BDZ89DRAFT_1044876 [Hymenopellis radicata]
MCAVVGIASPWPRDVGIVPPSGTPLQDRLMMGVAITAVDPPLGRHSTMFPATFGLVDSCSSSRPSQRRPAVPLLKPRQLPARILTTPDEDHPRPSSTEPRPSSRRTPLTTSRRPSSAISLGLQTHGHRECRLTAIGLQIRAIGTADSRPIGTADSRPSRLQIRAHRDCRLAPIGTADSRPSRLQTHGHRDCRLTAIETADSRPSRLQTRAHRDCRLTAIETADSRPSRLQTHGHRDCRLTAIEDCRLTAIETAASRPSGLQTHGHRDCSLAPIGTADSRRTTMTTSRVVPTSLKQ